MDEISEKNREMAEAVYETLVGMRRYEAAVPWVEPLGDWECPYYRARLRRDALCGRLLRRYGLELRELLEDPEAPGILEAMDTMERELAAEMFFWGVQAALENKIDFL